MQNLVAISDYISEQLVDSDRFVLMSETGGKGLPLIAFRLKKKAHYDEVIKKGRHTRAELTERHSI